ncbi:hypothetical protein GMMP15_1600004 [Candidatus Magnetomoraceae bacterium gMMP-15]
MKKYNMLFKVLCIVVVIISGCVSKNILDAATFYFATGDLEKVNINSNLIIDEDGFQTGNNVIQITGRLPIQLNNTHDFNWSDTKPDNNNIYWIKANNDSGVSGADDISVLLTLNANPTIIANATKEDFQLTFQYNKVRALKKSQITFLSTSSNRIRHFTLKYKGIIQTIQNITYDTDPKLRLQHRLVIEATFTDNQSGKVKKVPSPSPGSQKKSDKKQKQSIPKDKPESKKLTVKIDNFNLLDLKKKHYIELLNDKNNIISIHDAQQKLELNIPKNSWPKTVFLASSIGRIKLVGKGQEYSIGLKSNIISGTLQFKAKKGTLTNKPIQIEFYVVKGGQRIVLNSQSIDYKFLRWHHSPSNIKVDIFAESAQKKTYDLKSLPQIIELECKSIRSVYFKLDNGVHHALISLMAKLQDGSSILVSITELTHSKREDVLTYFPVADESLFYQTSINGILSGDKSIGSEKGSKANPIIIALPTGTASKQPQLIEGELDFNKISKVQVTITGQRLDSKTQVYFLGKTNEHGFLNYSFFAPPGVKNYHLTAIAHNYKSVDITLVLSKPQPRKKNYSFKIKNSSQDWVKKVEMIKKTSPVRRLKLSFAGTGECESKNGQLTILLDDNKTKLTMLSQTKYLPNNTFKIIDYQDNLKSEQGFAYYYKEKDSSKPKSFPYKLPNNSPINLILEAWKAIKIKPTYSNKKYNQIDTLRFTPKPQDNGYFILKCGASKNINYTIPGNRFYRTVSKNNLDLSSLKSTPIPGKPGKHEATLSINLIPKSRVTHLLIETAAFTGDTIKKLRSVVFKLDTKIRKFAHNEGKITEIKKETDLEWTRMKGEIKQILKEGIKELPDNKPAHLIYVIPVSTAYDWLKEINKLNNSRLRLDTRAEKFSVLLIEDSDTYNKELSNIKNAFKKLTSPTKGKVLSCKINQIKNKLSSLSKQ